MVALSIICKPASVSFTAVHLPIKLFSDFVCACTATDIRTLIDNQNFFMEYNIDCDYEEKDGYVFAREEGLLKMLEDIYNSSLKAGAAVEKADHIPVPVDFQSAIVFKQQAQIHPSKYVVALAKEFEKIGGTIVQNCRVTDVHEDEVHTIKTTVGELKTRRFI